jgi:hypothetical protein
MLPHVVWWKLTDISKVLTTTIIKVMSIRSSLTHFPVGSQLEHRALFGDSVISHTYRHTVGLLWTSDQPVAETSTYTGQRNI